MSEVQCKIEIAKMKGPLGESEEALTVGHEFLLHCEGTWPQMAEDKVELRVNPEDQHKLKLLRFKKESSNESTLLVTSYRAGDHQLKAPQLVDAENSVVLNDLNFTVKSVIENKEPPQEPYGPFGPIELRLSMFFWLMILIILLAMLAIVFRFFRRRWQKKKLLEEMALHGSALSPMGELSKHLRALQREHNQKNLEELNRFFRVYLARKYAIPTLVWTDKVILKDLRKNFPKIYTDHGDKIKKTLLELSLAMKQTKQLELKDYDQLLQLVRNCAEALES